MNYEKDLRELLSLAAKEEVSDIHFGRGYPPVFRINRKLIALDRFRSLTKEDTFGLAMAMLNENQKAKFLEEREVEFSYELEERVRFRTNIFFQKDCVSVAMRLIPSKIKTLEDLNLPPVLRNFCQSGQGFVLVTGPSSHGKSTTLAAMIDDINHQRAVHIITIEDPIEYYFEGDQAIINQREVGSDTLSFSRALRSSFRQDPDVVMVGEMRDRETMATALTAAETGHLVLSTLHTNDASQAIHRIVDSFPSTQQDQIRAQLSASLLGIISQRLLPRIRGGLIPACEIMLTSPAVANLIRENKIHEIPIVIETSAEKGMITLNKALANLVRAKEISLRTAVQHSSNAAELRRLVGTL